MDRSSRNRPWLAAACFLLLLVGGVPAGNAAILAPGTGGITFATRANLSPEPLPDRLANIRPPASLELQFQEFARQVSADAPDRSGRLVRGVWAGETLALPVVQQPATDPAYVSTREGELTQFRMAANQGVTGLLAHNYLAGALFYDLKLDQEVRVVYGDGSYQRYIITEIQQYQKLSLASLASDYIDLETGARLSTAALFGRLYRAGSRSGAPRLTFQTCLERAGEPSWGLTFVIAKPVD